MSNEKLIQEVVLILQTARSNTYRAVNTFMVEAYWQIGERIIRQEQGGDKRAEYGEGLIKTLSKALTIEFGKGFSVANLKNFRQFYITFPEFQKSYALRSELTWTHYRSIMRVENPKARNFYLTETATQNWSTRQLDRNIRSFYYERSLGENESLISSDAPNQPKDFLKDPYIFEFLNITEPHTTKETDLEASLVNNLQHFLLELGKGFSFVGRQFRISTEGSHFYIDLVFYNYLLKCFVLFDLKTTKLNHQDIGQMDMYVRMFDDLKRGHDDNPTIGIILCTNKDETIVKYSVLKGSEQLFASKYKLYLPTEEELIAEIERRRLWIEQKNT